MRRALLVPAIVQTSALDCGPVALAAALAGFGLQPPFERLRAACATGREGTSIDRLEEAAAAFGLAAEQRVVPADHLGLAAADLAPAIVVVVEPGGAPHFVTLWRLHGRRAQVVDPAAGRRWPRIADLAAALYCHRAVVPAAAWRAWAGSEGLQRPLAAQLAALGLAPAETRRRLDEAAADPGWRPLAALDAACRLTRQLAAAGAVRRGREAGLLLAALVEAEADGAGASAALPPTARSVWPAPCGPDGGERLMLEGAVVVTLRRRAGGEATAEAAPRPRVRSRAAAPWRKPRRPAAVLPAAAGACGLAVLRVAETAALAAVFLLLPGLAPCQARLAVAALSVLAAALLFGEHAALRGAAAAGLRAEMGLRRALAAKVPRLADRFVRSRLLADLAERAHLLGRARRGPELSSAALRAGAEAVLAAAAVAWFDPGLAGGAAAVAVATVALPLAVLPRLAERARRCRVQAGVLGAFYLDLLRGRAALQAHSAAEAFRRRHDHLLAGWLRARQAADQARAAAEGAAQGLAAAGAVALVLAAARRHGAGPGLLLVAAWSGQMAAAGRRLAHLLGAELPLHRALLQRFGELLAAEEEAEGEPPPSRGGEGDSAAVSPVAEPQGLPCLPPATSTGLCPSLRPPPEAAGPPPAAGRPRPARAAPGIAVKLRGLGVQTEGRWLLRGLDLDIAPGEHLALLGASGAGKSTLLGALLGWHRPAEGLIAFDGRPLAPPLPAAVLRTIAWSGPEVALWERSLLENLGYGLGGGEAGGGEEEPAAAPAADARVELPTVVAAAAPPADLALSEALRLARLLGIVEQLPQGLQTRLGEAGGVLSGGEQQRVRLARALLRPGVRLVLLDEALRGLGADERRRLLDACRARWRGATLLCVTHAPAEALAFDRIAILEESRLAEHGVPDALAAQPGSRFRRMLDAEASVAAALAAPPWRQLRLARGRLHEADGSGRRR